MGDNIKLVIDITCLAGLNNPRGTRILGKYKEGVGCQTGS